MLNNINIKYQLKKILIVKIPPATAVSALSTLELSSEKADNIVETKITQK